MFEKPENWNVVVEAAYTADAYKAIVENMFDDHIVNAGRLLVLEVYTQDVCKRYPVITEDVENLYSQVHDQLNHQLNHQWNYSLPDFLQGFCQCLANCLLACSSFI